MQGSVRLTAPARVPHPPARPGPRDAARDGGRAGGWGCRRVCVVVLLLLLLLLRGLGLSLRWYKCNTLHAALPCDVG